MFRGRADDWGDCPAALNMTVSETGLLTGTWDGRIPIRGLHTWEQREDSDGEKYYRYYTASRTRATPHSARAPDSGRWQSAQRAAQSQSLIGSQRNELSKRAGAKWCRPFSLQPIFGAAHARAPRFG